MSTLPTVDSDATGVVHLISATLRDDLPADLVASTLERAHALREAPGARSVLVAHSHASVIVATWLTDRSRLEPFAASPPHMEFVMRGLAPSITGMWAAGIETSALPPIPDEVVSLWAFAARSDDTVFEWQVRDLLASIERLPATVAAGPTFEERDRYRAGGVACVTDANREAFKHALAETRSTWGEMAPHIVEASAQVVV